MEQAAREALEKQARGSRSGAGNSTSTLLPPPSGRVPLLKQTTEKDRVPVFYSLKSAGLSYMKEPIITDNFPLGI